MISSINIRNVKGISKSLSLGKVTNLIGPNGSGKSAVLESIQIALSGFTSRGKLAGKTFELCSANEKSMEISVESETSQTLSRKFERSGSGAKQTILLNGEKFGEKDELPSCFAFPVEAVHPSEFIGMSPEKRADYIFSALPEEINSIFPDQIKEKFDFFKEKTSFSSLLETLKSKKSELEKEIKRCLANIQKLTGELGQSPAGNLAEWEEKKAKTAEDLSSVTAEIATNEERSKTATNRAEQVARLQKNISESLQKIEETEKKIATLKAAIIDVSLLKDAARPSNQTLLKERAVLSDAITSARTKKSQLDDKLEILQAKGCCPFCNSLLTQIEESLDLWELESANLAAAIEENQEKLADLDKKIELNNREIEAETKNKEINLEIKVEADALSRYKKFYDQNAADLEVVDGKAGEAPVSLDVLRARQEGLRAQLKEADEAIKSFVALKSVREQRTKSEQERMSHEQTLETIKGAIESVKALRNERETEARELLSEPFSIVASSALGHDAYLALVDEKDKWCFDFGLLKNSRVSFDTLSGGEKVIMLAALVACIQKIKTGRVGIGLFELAEADDKSVAALIEAVEKIDFEQIIIASCHGKPIEGAVNIDMGEKA